MSLFKETIRKQFGFPSKRESLDHQIENYRINEAIALDEAMALRQESISYLEEQIRQLEQVINDNQLFIDTYESIKRIAIEKVKMGSSAITAQIVDNKGNSVIKANYATIENYFIPIQKSGNIELIKTYTEQKGEILEKMWQAYAFKVIQGKGLFPGGDSDFYEAMDIYSLYQKALININSGRLKNAQREAVNVSRSNISLIIAAHEFSQHTNSILILALQKLQNALRDVQNEQANDQYTRNTIKEMQTMLKSTLEYFHAKRDEEILDRISKT